MFRLRTAAFLLFALTAFALEVPYLSGPLVDEAGLLSPEENARVMGFLEKLNATGRAQMAILIARSLQDHDIESYSIAVAEKWKLGKKGADNGILLIIAPNERKMRLEVGYGHEGELTDIFSKQLLSDEVAPYFRERRYGDGLAAAIDRVSEKIGAGIDAPVERPIRKARVRKGFPLGLVFPLLLLVLFLRVFLNGVGGARRYHRGGRNDWWSGGGGRSGGWGGGGWSGGGGFSGGGGGFGGGGASSSW